MKNIKDATFMVRLNCRDCGALLNETRPMTFEEFSKDYGLLSMAAGFNSGNCPNECRSTFSDLNLNFNMTIMDAETRKVFEYRTIKYLRGNFYLEDYGQVCTCEARSEDEVYFSDKYPAVHGVCGRWLTVYSR
jgi:hypothetical protein